MDNSFVSWLPVIALVIVYTIDKVIAQLRARGIDLNKMAKQLDHIDEADLPGMSRRLRELHGWHDKTDEDGVRIWYVRRSLETAIRDLSENVKAQTELLRTMVSKMDSMDEKLDAAISGRKANAIK